MTATATNNGKVQSRSHISTIVNGSPHYLYKSDGKWVWASPRDMGGKDPYAFTPDEAQTIAKMNRDQGQESYFHPAQNAPILPPLPTDPQAPPAPELPTQSEQLYWASISGTNPRVYLFRNGSKGRGKRELMTLEGANGREPEYLTYPQIQKWNERPENQQLRVMLETPFTLPKPAQNSGDNGSSSDSQGVTGQPEGANSSQAPRGFMDKLFGPWGKEKQPAQPAQPETSPNQSEAPNQPEQGNQKPETKAQRRKRRFDLVSFVLLFALGIGLFLAIAWNVQPFIHFVTVIAAKGTFALFFAWLATLPLIGGLFTAIGAFGTAVGGFAIYAVCQVIEVSALLYAINPKKTAAVLDKAKFWKKYKHEAGDSKTITRLKNTYNSHPESSYSWLIRAAVVVYCFELFVVLLASPWSVPMSAFISYLFTFQWNKILWINLAQTISVLFLVQFIAAGIIKVFPEVYPIDESQD